MSNGSVANEIVWERCIEMDRKARRVQWVFLHLKSFSNVTCDSKKNHRYYFVISKLKKEIANSRPHEIPTR